VGAVSSGKWSIAKWSRKVRDCLLHASWPSILPRQQSMMVEFTGNADAFTQAA
jgi:hypothetical protein